MSGGRGLGARAGGRSHGQLVSGPLSPKAVQVLRKPPTGPASGRRSGAFMPSSTRPRTPMAAGRTAWE
jgi:hypothetical protein